MAEEIDDSEFFHQDFTTASEWEIFNARLEEIFHEWKLPFAKVKPSLKTNQLYSVEWELKTESIFFADVELNVKLYRAQIPENDNDDLETSTLNNEHQQHQEQLNNKIKKTQAHFDLMNLENNFCNYDYNLNNEHNIHPLAVWYGIREFVVIEPADNPIVNESQCRVLLSSACITVAESNTEIPVFIHIMQKELNVYFGVCEATGIRTNFNIVALETVVPTCKYLSGLLSMFKGKIGLTYLNPVTVSVRLSYNLTDFVNTSFQVKGKVPFSSDSDESESDEEFTISSNFYALPYGVSMDPVKEIILNCTWPEIAENVIVDSSTYTDLDPILAPIWSIRVDFKQQPIYYLTDAVTEYLKLSENSRTLASVVGSSYEIGGTQNFDGTNPLDLLTESKIPSIKSVLPIRKGSDKIKNKIEGPLKEDELMQMLYYMFPDAQKDPTYPYEISENDNIESLRIKTAIPDSLVFRLSILLATCDAYFGGIPAIGQLWAEFTQEMRYRVERCIQIPGIATGFPDSRTCLLHQKLQMLNICMERRRLREGGLPFSMAVTSKTSDIVQQEDSDDEFYDCSDEEEKDDDIVPWNKPAGRLSKLGNLKLVDSDEPIYVPVTQEPVPKTEDQLEDDAEVMLKLGPGSELCTQMMSASLLSDMESFKAANPNGKIEDFIRWYSPRDWIEEKNENGEIKGHLSPRMLIPGNTWQTVWNAAKPVPARKQRRLFDDTKEAEKVLHYFETRNIGQICQLTVAPIFHSIFLKLKDELKKTNLFDDFSEKIDKITTGLCKISRDNWKLSTSMTEILPHLPPSHKKWENLLNEMILLEQQTLKARSLSFKIFSSTKSLTEEQKSIILPLLKGHEAVIEGGAKNEISVRLLNMFADARLSKSEFGTNDFPENQNQLYLPQAIRKEYILRVDGKTKNKGIGGPQFLRAILDKNMRLCGAFSVNTAFF